MEEEEIAEAQERLRAHYIIEKAERDKLNVLDTLVTHMVSRFLIEELTGEVVVHERRVREDKSAQLHQWVRRNESKKFGTSKLVQELGVSYDTVLKIVRENPMFFTKVGRGQYEIRDGIAEREEAKKAQKQ